MEHKYFVSFIVPFKNEEQFLENCILSILKNFNDLDAELILLDNGSTDNSKQIALKYKEKSSYYFVPDKTIAGVRNFGAEKARGEWLVFIDGDMEIGDNWGNIFKQFVKNYNFNQNIITGSTAIIPKNSTWVERTWYSYLQKRDQHSNSYINSGHLVIHSNLFWKINGFDEHLQTGEDEKLCIEAKKSGGLIIKNTDLIAIHYGYPKTLKQFFKREKWHGRDIRLNLKYKDFQLAVYNLGVLIIALTSPFLFNISVATLGALISGLLLFPPLFVSIIKLRSNIKTVLKGTILIFVYGLAKTSALIEKLLRSTHKMEKWR